MHYDRATPSVEIERTFSFPLSFVFEKVDGRLAVVFGATEEIKLGYCVLAVNGVKTNGTVLEDGRDILEVSIALNLHLRLLYCSCLEIHPIIPLQYAWGLRLYDPTTK